MKFPSVFTSAICVLALALPSTVATAEPAKKMLAILTSSDSDTQAMALALTNSAAQAGASVHLLLCSAAGDIALKDAPEAARKPIIPNGMSAQALMKALIAKGAKVDVCAIYLPNRKLQPDALAEQIGVANPQAIAAEMMDSETRLAAF